MTTWHGAVEIHTDAMSYLVNHQNPLLGRLFASSAQAVPSQLLSATSYLGFLPLALVILALLTKMTRRKAAPWALLCAFFLTLRLGSHLVVQGKTYTAIRLPKYYLNQLFRNYSRPSRKPIYS